MKKLLGWCALAFLAYVAFIMFTSGGFSGDPESAADAGVSAGKAGVDAAREHAPNVDPATKVDQGLSWWEKMMAISPHMPEYIASGVLAVAAIAFWRWLPGKARGLLFVVAGVILGAAVLK